MTEVVIIVKKTIYNQADNRIVSGRIPLIIDFQKIHFARQQGGDHTVVYLRPITQRNYFSESL
jgi:hypothetical protein